MDLSVSISRINVILKTMASTLIRTASTIVPMCAILTTRVGPLRCSHPLRPHDVLSKVPALSQLMASPLSQWKIVALLLRLLYRIFALGNKDVSLCRKWVTFAKGK